MLCLHEDHWEHFKKMPGQGSFSRAVSMIYEAAISPDKWDDALLAIAESMDAAQAAIMILESGKLVDGAMPTMDPAHLKTYAQIKAQDPSDMIGTDPAMVALGRVVSFDDLHLRESFESSIEFREWWAEHDLDAGALFANLSLGGSRLAQVGVYRSGNQRFSSDERNRLELLCDHLIRAGRIERRVNTNAAEIGTADDSSHAGMLIVDREYRVLNEQGVTLDELQTFGILRYSQSDGTIRIDSPRLRELVDRTRSPERMGGSCSFTRDDGERLWVDIAPIGMSGARQTDWLNVDRPAALLHFTIPLKRTSLRVCGLAEEFGLTPAERAVAIEIVKGDGRAATAKRLGISESTVRSHLSVIFEKMGIHRQSELIELIVG